MYSQHIEIEFELEIDFEFQFYFHLELEPALGRHSITVGDEVSYFEVDKWRRRLVLALQELVVEELVPDLSLHPPALSPVNLLLLVVVSLLLTHQAGFGKSSGTDHLIYV